MRTRARLVTTAGVLCSAALVLMLHVVRTDVPPVSHRLSEYATGPHGWMMTTAFVALGCGLAALGWALLAERPRGATWIVPVAGLVAALGMIASGMFPTGVSDTSEVIHSRASISATVIVVGLALAHATSAARRWSDVPTDRVGTGLAVAAVALAAMAPVLHDTEWTGLGQRLLWLVLLAWVLRALWKRPVQARASGHAPGGAKVQSARFDS